LFNSVFGAVQPALQHTPHATTSMVIVAITREDATVP